MKMIRENIVCRFLWLFMAVLILNVSIDSPDSHDYYEKDDLSINDMESVVEVVLEEIMGINDAIPEFDEDSGLGFCHLSLDFEICVLTSPFESLEFHVPYCETKLYKFNDTILEQFKPELTTPPPDSNFFVI